MFSEIRSDASLAEDEVKSCLLAEFRKEALATGPLSNRDSVVTTALWQFADKHRYARKKTKGRSFSYEFNRLTLDVQLALDEAIGNVLATHLKG